ncbi:MAG: hypothetical protein OEZ39_06225 [Gammaproteobacteria bacterium]|nr:hypothetical protein [Gammaproteobacteria bacterium]MDH5651452.1 hypothetical protein [Gammaproteobacteria bacterium]
MLEQFLQQLALIHPHLEYLGRWSIYIIAVLIFWLLLSVPFAIIHSAISKYLIRLYDFFLELSSKVWNRVKEMVAGLGEAKSRFVDSNSLLLRLDYYDRVIRDMVKKTKGKVEESAKKINEHTDSFAENVAQIDKNSAEIIRQVEEFSSKVERKAELIAPDDKTAIEQSVTKREGWAKLIIGIIGGFSLIGINTFLLNQFFASFISMHVLGLSLSMILSLFFSVLEGILGIVLFYQQKKLKGEDIRHHLGEAAIFLLIAALMAIEFVLYMVLSGQMDQEIFVSIFAPDPVPGYFKFWLAPFGVVVVGVLAFCGHLLIEGLTLIQQTTALGSIGKRLATYRNQTRTLNQGFENLNNLSDKIREGLDRYRNDLKGMDDNKPLVSADIVASMSELSALADGAHRERTSPEVSGKIDVESSFYQYIFFGIGTAVVTWLFVWSQNIFMQKMQIFGAIPDSIYLIIALSETLVLLAAGLWISRPRVLTMGEGAQMVAEQPTSRWALLALIGIVLGILAFNAFMIIRENTRNEWSWFMMMLACIVALLYFGRNLKHILSACWYFVVTVARAIAIIVPVAFYIICYAISWLGKILDVVIELIAYPSIKLSRLISSRRKDASASGKELTVDGALQEAG